MNLRTMKLFLIIVLLVLVFYLLIKIKINRETFGSGFGMLSPEMSAKQDITAKITTECTPESKNTSSCYKKLIKYYTDRFITKLKNDIVLDYILEDKDIGFLPYIKSLKDKTIVKGHIEVLDNKILPSLLKLPEKIDGIKVENLLKIEYLNNVDVDLKLIYKTIFEMMPSNIKKTINEIKEEIVDTTTTTTTVSPEEITQKHLNAIKQNKTKPIVDIFKDKYHEDQINELQTHKEQFLKPIVDIFENIYNDTDTTEMLKMYTPKLFNTNLDNIKNVLNNDINMKNMTTNTHELIDNIINDVDRYRKDKQKETK